MMGLWKPRWADDKPPVDVRAVFSGFDSAWTAGNQGAIAGITLVNGNLGFLEPVTAGFSTALTELREHERGFPLHIVAIDQPLIVPNETSCRPVERAVSPTISRCNGGMQCAYRGKREMFGDGAPIWPFLEALDAVIHPVNSTGATSGRYAVEVYPVLAILGLLPVFYECKRLPKYNPDKRKNFSIVDWQMLCTLVAAAYQALEIAAGADWCLASSEIERPRKPDQDKLDAAICALVGYLWWRHGTRHSLVVGDLATGYIVSPTNPPLAAALRTKANAIGVPIL